MVVEAQLVAAVMPVDGFLRLMVPRSQAGSGDQSGVQGSRPPASLTSQRRLQSTNAVYWGGSPATQSSRLCHITDANPSFGAAPPFAIFESFPAVAIYSRPKRRWGASYGCDSGVAESQTATFSLEESAVCAAECH